MGMRRDAAMRGGWDDVCAAAGRRDRVRAGMRWLAHLRLAVVVVVVGRHR